MSHARARALLTKRLQHTITLALTLSASVTFAGCSRSAARTDAADSSSTAAAGATASAERGDSAANAALVADTNSQAAAPGGSTTPAATPTSTPAAAPDTARGIVRRLGAEPLSTLMLMPRDGQAGEALALEGAASAELLAAEGLEVMVRGTRTTKRAASAGPNGAFIFTVTQFAVRAADGVTARDGILVQINGAWMLESATGARSAITGLPAALQSQRGARIFLVGPIAQAPQAFGILRAK